MASAVSSEVDIPYVYQLSSFRSLSPDDFPFDIIRLEPLHPEYPDASQDYQVYRYIVTTPQRVSVSKFCDIMGIYHARAIPRDTPKTRRW